jgi:hypothetical protein
MISDITMIRSRFFFDFFTFATTILCKNKKLMVITKMNSDSRPLPENAGNTSVRMVDRRSSEKRFLSIQARILL